MTIEQLLEHERQLERACASNPGLWNLIQAEREWALYGDACDPLSAAAPERALKSLQREIYLDLWADTLSRLAPDTRCLVAGGGTGRFAQVLVNAGAMVELIDASPSAIERARKHLGETVPATVGDITRPETISRSDYDLALAVEVPCYVTDPSRVMTNLHAALRPGGRLLFSVEARPGALLADNDLISPSSVRSVLENGVVTLPGLKHVHYYTRSGSRSLAENAGFEVTEVEGVCYVPDGPLAHLVDATHLEDEAHRAEILSLERKCRDDAALCELPRAWAVTAVAT